jgi:hypothetical protein
MKTLPLILILSPSQNYLNFIHNFIPIVKTIIHLIHHVNYNYHSYLIIYFDILYHFYVYHSNYYLTNTNDLLENDFKDFFYCFFENTLTFFCLKFYYFEKKIYCSLL